jgi:hypothetical protein
VSKRKSTPVKDDVEAPRSLDADDPATRRGGTTRVPFPDGDVLIGAEHLAAKYKAASDTNRVFQMGRSALREERAAQAQEAAKKPRRRDPLRALFIKALAAYRAEGLELKEAIASLGATSHARLRLVCTGDVFVLTDEDAQEPKDAEREYKLKGLEALWKAAGSILR